MTIPNARPVDIIGMEIDDLFDSAGQFLDGEPIATEGQAEAVARLLDMLRKAKKAADDQRAAEKKPHDDAGKAVQALWKPLLDKCDLAAATCKKALAPYLEAKERAQREVAEAARREADRLAQAAREAAALARSDDLAAQADAEAKIKAAAAADKLASKADKATSNVAGGARAVGLRTYYTVELDNAKEALRHYMIRQPDALKAWLVEQAQRDVNAGAREIPGFLIHEDRRAA